MGLCYPKLARWSMRFLQCEKEMEIFVFYKAVQSSGEGLPTLRRGSSREGRVPRKAVSETNTMSLSHHLRNRDSDRPAGVKNPT